MTRLLQRRPTRLLVAVAAAATVTGVALAYFSAPGSGKMPARVGNFSAATIWTPASSSASVTINWTSAATLGNPSLDNAISYSLERRHGAGSYAAITSGPCSGTLPSQTSSCTDTLPASGSYSYRAIATFKSWTAASNETSVNATVPVATTTTLISSSNPSIVGEDVTYTATVTTTSPQPLTGTITFKEDTTTVSCATGSAAFDGTSATCTVTYSASDGSPHTVTAIYNGDKNFLSSTSNEVDQSVNETAQTNTTTATPARTTTSP